MKRNKKITSDLFEIHDTDINVVEIMEDIESRLKKISIEKEEIERIARLKFHPPGPGGYREFDALGTANLFENGVSIPKFTNPSLWFIKGPIKWLIVQLVAMYSVVERKLSENRISAFYNVIHELILLKNKVNRLNEKLDLFYADFAEMMTKLKTGLNPDYFVSDSLYDRDYEKYKTDLILGNLEKSDRVLVLYPGWGWILSSLHEKGIRFHSVTDSTYKLGFIKKEITSSVEYLNSMIDYDNYKKYNKIIIYRNLGFLTGWLIDALVQKIFRLADKHTEVLVVYSSFPESAGFPFESAGITRVKSEKLKDYLRDTGYKNIRIMNNGSEMIARFTKP